jgi:hypothetical protein
MHLATDGANRVVHTNKLEHELGSLSFLHAEADSVEGVYGIWKPLIDKIEAVVRVGNEIARVCSSLNRSRRSLNFSHVI